MSALGDYVHFHKNNYLIYGTAFRGETAQHYDKSYIAQKNRHAERMRSIRTIAPGTLDELEKRISNESTQQEARQVAEGILQTNNSLDEITKNLKAKLLAEVPAKFTSADSGIRIVKAKLQTDTSMVNLEAAKQARRRFYRNIDTINKNTQKGKPIRQTTIDALLRNASEFFNCLGIVNKDLDFIKYRNLDNANTAAALKNMVKLVSVSEIGKATLNGVYGETLANMVSDNLQSLTGEALLTEVRDKLETGKHRTNFQLDSSMIKPWAQRAFYRKTKLNLYQIKGSQDKVDASIIINDMPMDVSAKAYSAYGNTINPHLQDVSLLTTLAATAGQFGNHWLNIHALDIPFHSADEELRKQIQYEALVSGNLLKKGAGIADTFVAIDVLKGRVSVKTTKDMLENESQFFTINPDPKDIIIKNEWAERSWMDRIVDILIDIHQYQFTVSYKISFK